MATETKVIVDAEAVGALAASAAAHRARLICEDLSDMELDEHLDEFHRRECGVGPFRHYSDTLCTSLQKRQLDDSNDRRLNVLGWLPRLCPVGLSAQCTIKSMIMLASMTDGRLVRTPQAGNLEHTINKTRSHREAVCVIHDIWLNYELECIGKWADEVHCNDRHPAMRTAAVVGSGVIGALDGVVTEPWAVYTEWSQPRVLSIADAVRMRLLSGLGFGTERILDGTNQGWIEGDRQLLMAYSVLDNVRKLDRDAYEAWVVRQVTAHFAEWQQHGWMYHEIEAGDLIDPTSIVSPRAIWLMDQVLDLKVASYKHTFSDKSAT